MSSTGTTGATGAPPPPTTQEVLARVQVRLAGEGVPVRAIARATKTPSEEVREVLEDAHLTGVILQLPRDDWPPAQSNGDRAPEVRRTPVVDDDIVRLNVVRLFKVTQQQASLLLVLIKRREVTRKMLHAVIEGRRPHPKVETDQKIVDVVICKLRKKLEPFDLRISTVWSCGYLMSPEDRARALALLREFMDAPDAVRVEEPAAQ
jgi:DNA-binding response OmpR family regulator